MLSSSVCLLFFLHTQRDGHMCVIWKPCPQWFKDSTQMHTEQRLWVWESLPSLSDRRCMSHRHLSFVLGFFLICNIRIINAMISLIRSRVICDSHLIRVIFFLCVRFVWIFAKRHSFSYFVRRWQRQCNGWQT